MGPRSWSRRVYISARVTSGEERTALTRLGSRGGQGGGPAPEEARPGRVCVGGRLRPAPGLGGELGAGPGRLRPPGAAGGLDSSFLPRRALSPPRTFLASAAGWHDRLYSAVLLFSLSTPAPCCQLPLFPGGREARLCAESVLNKTKTGSVTRTSSDRLRGPSRAELALGDRAPERRGGARGVGEALRGSGRAGPAALCAGQPAPLAPLGRFYSVGKGQKMFHNTRSAPDCSFWCSSGARVPGCLCRRQVPRE
ncbi:uncharacterized protein LOC124994858 [Sciurus carolinensis]|uniref:uncharacterized protein LOC124994858 n=1 Tax=Sciurus carolinensis TaxID=30640 RepID=UPI001FB4D52A|nr:uncharacterized protein LOC124994858 [Sciurus carolinensis]